MGDNKVQEYLYDEDIPLLLEIPFKKEIAELYSTGRIVSETDSFFAKQLMAIVEKITLNNMEIAIISGKGGTGKSSISAAFATLNGRCSSGRL